MMPKLKSFCAVLDDFDVFVAGPLSTGGSTMAQSQLIAHSYIRPLLG